MVLVTGLDSVTKSVVELDTGVVVELLSGLDVVSGSDV